MDKTNRELSPRKKPEVCILEDLKPFKSRHRNNKKEPYAVKTGDTAECKCGVVQNNNHLLQYGMTIIKYERTNIFKEPNDTVMKRINYWFRKGI